MGHVDKAGGENGPAGKEFQERIITRLEMRREHLKARRTVVCFSWARPGLAHEELLRDQVGT